MPFLLLGVGGPVIGVARRLDGGPLTIGRGPSNQLPLADAAVSRRHCVLEPAEDSVLLRDRESFNGTFVNGVRVGEARLGHGDELRICSCVFRVVDERLDSDPDSGSPASGAGVVVRTRRLDPDPESPFDLEQLARRLHRQEQYQLELAALLELAASLPPLPGFSEAKRRFFEVVFRMLPVESAALLMLDPSGSAVAAAYGWKRERRPGGVRQGARGRSGPVSGGQDGGCRGSRGVAASPLGVPAAV